MNQTFSRWSIAAALTLVTLTNGCTMKSQDVPSITGPSELGTAITVSVSPDVLTQDGGSQAKVTVRAFDSNGKPLRGVTMRSEILVGGVSAEFGTLSAHSIVTESDGVATLWYTAPPAPAGPAVDTNTTVRIAVRPVEDKDYANSIARFATIRLVPPGIVVPPDGLQPAFTPDLKNTKVVDNQVLFFDASTSRSSPTNPIVSFSWDFGDGARANGTTASHSYSLSGTYLVTLTVTDGFNRSASTTQTLIVGAGDAPSAKFLFSPTTPKALDVVNFNAAESRPAAGREIRTYAWDFGDGDQKTTTTATTTHDFKDPGAYVVTLVVTDDVGRTAFDKQPITVK